MKQHPDSAPETPFEDLPPSKSQRKRDMLALQDMGEDLVQLTRQRLATMHLPDDLLAAVLDAQRIRAHGARRRQMQYIGKLMRDIDAEPIREALDVINNQSDAANARMHKLERWRDALMADEGALATILAEAPGADIQRLRQLRRNALKEQEQAKPPRAYREIFQALKEALEAPRGPATEPEESE
jgi:ribosome-associated protein